MIKASNKLIFFLTGMLSTCVLSSIIAYNFFAPPPGALDMPFVYVGDSAWAAASIKGMKDNGWFYENKFMGAPGVQDMRDFPTFDLLHQAVIKVISLFGASPFRAMNLFYFLTFPLTAAAAFCAFQCLGLTWLSSVSAALLYALLPYHFIRYSHLFLSAYFVVPLTILVIWVAFSRASDEKNKNGRTPWYLISAAFATGLAGIYYAYFASFFVAVAAGWKYLTQRSISSIKPFLIILAGILTAGLLQSVPNQYNKHTNGPNTAAVARIPSGTEKFGLRIMQMLLPVDGHRIAKLAALKRQYVENAPAVNENNSASLGVMGAIGFVLLVAVFFYMAMSQKNLFPPAPIQFAAVLTMAGVLFASMGGFGSLAMVVIPEIRGYNRISVYIAFFSLFALFHFLERVSAAQRLEKVKRIVFPAIVLLITITGIYDQLSPAYRPDWPALEKAWSNDKVFTETVEARLPQNAMIFQLPYMPFPESKPVAGMNDYEPLKPYLHSKSLRWSYGAIKGRDIDAWQKETAAKPAKAMIAEIRSKGFAAIYIDRTGFQDKAASLEAAVTAVVKKAPITSGDGRLSVFIL